MYENFIFDLYGTLADIRTNETKAHLWKKLSIFYHFHGAAYTPSELSKSFRIHTSKIPLSTDPHREYQIENIFRTLYEEKNISCDSSLAVYTAEFFRTLSTEYLRLYDGIEQMLYSLKSQGKNLYLLTNAQRVFTLPEINMLGLSSCFDGILISSDIGYAKPSSNFFQALFSLYTLQKNKSIMIGNDSITDIQGATSFGIASIYIHSNLSPELSSPVPAQYSILDGSIPTLQKLLQSL